MGNVHVKVDEIIGDTEDVIRLCKEGGLDLSRIVKTNKKIDVPSWALYVFPLLFLASLCGTIFISNEYAKVKIVLSLIALALSFVNTALVYAKWERQPLLWVTIIAHLALIGVTYGVYSIEDVVKKAEDVITNTAK